MVERACKVCRRLLKGTSCPIDKSTDLTRSWRGVILVIDPANSQLAKEAGITSPGKFAIRVK
jgi:DNA-directed RNA polymerase subunit E"